MTSEHDQGLPGAPTARDLRWQVVEMLGCLLPQPKNHATRVGFGLRKLRLERELARYDEFYRQNFLQPASFDQLYGVGLLLVCSKGSPFRGGRFPEEDSLMVNTLSFAGILDRVEKRLAEALET